MEAEIRRLVEFLSADGRYGDFLIDDDSADTPQTPPDDIDEDDIPPRQRPLWE